MAGAAGGKARTSGTGEVQRVVVLLGGPRVFRRQINTALDAHEMLVKGLPSKALSHLMGNLVVLRKSRSLERAIGMSLRTYQRRKETPAKPLDPEQSGRTWKFAEILAKATELFGSQEGAEQWLARPAMGLEQRRPIDLLSTPAGVELVENFLDRLEYGVYT